MRILGIDVSSTQTGWALLDDDRLLEWGVIVPKRRDPLEKRLLFLYEQLQSLFDRLKPGLVACEEVYVRFVKAAGALYQARAMVVLACAQAGLELVFIEATKAKQSLTGSGGSSKHNVQTWVTSQYGADVGSEHAADAVSVAHAARMVHDHATTGRQENETL